MPRWVVGAPYGTEGFERILVLVETDATSLDELPAKAEAAAQGVDKAFKTTPMKSYQQMLRGTRKEVLAVVEGQKAVGISAQTMAKDLMDAGRTQEISTSIMRQAGYSAKETTKAFEELDPAAKGVSDSFQRVAKAVKFAVFRFFTALIIYQAFRQIIRGINEAITTSIRLFKEYAQQQRVLKTILEVNNQLLNVQVGTLEEWNDFIAKSSKTLGGTRTAWLKAVNTALEFNATLGLTNEELERLVELGMAVAQMWGMYSEGQLDIAEGTKTVMDAIRGQEAALLKLGIRQTDIAAKVGLTADEFDALTDAQQENVRWAYIVEERYEALGTAAVESMTDAERATIKMETASDNLYVALGRFIARAKERSRVVQIMTRFSTSATDAMIGLTESVEEGARQAIAAAAAWTKLQGAIAGLGEVADKVGRIFDQVTGRIRQAAREGFEAAMELGRSIGDAFIENMRSVEDAARNFSRRMADITADLARNIDRLNRRFIARAAELVLRAEERKEDIREDFRQREEDERDDLNLRLKHMEEDFLLDMKHMREDYEMDIEEAARARDWRAIRTLQRRYGLEKRQRTDDYKLNRKQFIESWNQRHKQRKKDLDKELKEVEDNLAKQLEALERQRQQELEELKIRAQERRDELKAQYAQELEDLQRNLDRRLADILVAAVAEGNIRVGEATRVTNTLATLYGIDQQNLENMVRHDVEWLNTWSSAWESAITRIAQARGSVAGLTMGGQFYPYPTAPFAFAKGGAFVTSGPTPILVGERGPELVNVIPLAKGGSVLGGLQNRMGGDFNLTIDGNQSGLWGSDFERGVEQTVANIFREAFEE